MIPLSRKVKVVRAESRGGTYMLPPSEEVRHAADGHGRWDRQSRAGTGNVDPPVTRT